MIDQTDFIQDNPWTKAQIKKAKADFRVFVFILWRTLGLPEPTPIQYDIAKSLMNPMSDRFIIQGFRGVAKSYLTCAYAVWQLWKNPQIKVLVVSASKDRADANAVFIKRIITLLPFLKELLPTDKQRNTQNVFDVGLAVPDISPSVKSVGITGQITGSRADLLIADDVEIPNNSATQVQRDKLNESVKEFDSILKPGGQILYLGTPQSEMSLYNELQKRGYTARVWTVEYPSTQKERDEYGDTLAPYIAKDWEDKKGKPTDPMRFDELEIAKRRLSYGKAGFSLQFMLNTNLSDIERYPLKIQDLIVTDLDMKEASLKWNWCADAGKRHADLASVALKGDYFYAPLSRSEETETYTGTVMAIDPSGRGKDETAYAIIKYLNGYLFVMEVGGYQTGYSESTLTNLANQAKFWGVNTVLYESNFGDGMFGQLLKPVFNRIHPCAMEEVRSMAQKEKRIVETLEPVMMRHKLIVNKTVIKEDYKVYENNQHYSLIYQMTRLTTDRGALAHDDRLDALSMAISYWKDVMDRDEQQGID
ncbi:MAG: phage terminase large subunit, partial [Dialister sp.]|nr:phage terminase large subunit [Dialister sp.]